MQNELVIMHVTLPVSAGLLHNVDTYMGALDAYHQGNIEPIVACLFEALELSVVLGAKICANVDEVLEKWEELITDRKGSASHQLATLLVEQPVVNVSYVAKQLEITDRAARNLIERACERGILAKMGNAKRGAFYQASQLVEILEEASSVQGIRRMVSGERAE